jgi:hypothetical protein
MMRTFLSPLPLKVTYVHLFSPIGSSPFSSNLEVQLSHRLVVVPPGCVSDKNSSRDLEARLTVAYHV